MKEEWVMNIRGQCEAAKVPFFFKQWGGVRKSEAGRLLGGRTYDAMPERPVRRVPAHHLRMDMIEEVRRWEGVSEPLALTVISADGVERQPLLFQ